MQALTGEIAIGAYVDQALGGDWREIFFLQYFYPIQSRLTALDLGFFLFL